MPSALLCKQMNPRVVWCFSSESYMGMCRKLALASNTASGNGLGVKSCNLVIERYEGAMHITMENLDMYFWGVM